MSRSFPDRFLQMISRRKLFPTKGIDDKGPLLRTVTLFHLCLYGIGAMCGGYIYGVSIVLVATKSGGSSFLSNILAGSIAAINAQCYSELSSRLPVGGGGYSFTYTLCGELLAFITGWAMLLEYLLGFAFSSVGASNAIDFLSNHTINSAIGASLGTLPSTNGYLTSTPNILGALVAIFIIILLGFGAKISIRVNSAITITSTVILLACAIYMACNSSLRQFSSARLVNLTTGVKTRSDWMPFGVVGVIGGAALTFNAFIGFDALALTGDVVIDPRRNLPLSTNIAIVIVFFITTFYYLCVSFYRPWFEVDPKLGLSGLFYKQGVFPMQILACIGELTGYLTSAFANMFALSHIVFCMSRDGLLFPCFHYISKTFQVPIVTNIVFGILGVMMAILFDLDIIAHFMSAGTLITYTFVAIDLLILRLINVEKLEIAIPDDKIGSTFSIKDVSFTPSIEEHCCSSRVIGRPICLILCIFVLLLSCSVGSGLGTSSLLNFTGKISVLSVSLAFILLSCAVLFLFKYYVPDDGFRVRMVPFVPIACIVLNILLASNLSILVWGRLLVWLFLGLIFYGCYGIWHSNLGKEDGESSLIVKRKPSESLALSTD